MSTKLKIRETTQEISTRLYKYILPMLKKALITSMREIDNYYNDVFIDTMLEESALIKWLRSDKGRGFVGWTTSMLEEEVEKMKREMKKQKRYVLKNSIIEINKISSVKLEEILKVGVKRYNRLAATKNGMYTFIEPWYEWITNGYIATSSTGVYKVLYGKGLGFSGLAEMVDVRSPKAAGAAQNRINRLEEPAIEIHRENFKIITDELIKIVTKNVELELK